MILKLLSVLLCTCLFASATYAEETPITELKNFLQSSAVMSADFRQVSLDKAGQPAQSRLGRFYLSRPGKFRWNYQKPYAQEIVSNGGKVWFYDADLDQVTIKKLDDSLGSTPALLLTGQINLEEKFKLEEQGKDEDMHWVKLIPKDEEGGFKYILIGMEKGQLSGMELSDNFGQLTRVYFSNIQLNPAIDESMFIFKVPKGADVFEN